MSALRYGTSQQGIAYIACGPQDSSKPALICVHGWACQASDYTYMFNELLKQNGGFQALAISLPAHGGSSKDSYPVASTYTFAESVLTVVNELDIANVVLMGHSMGVRVVLEAWKQTQSKTKPEVNALVFLDGSHYKFRPLFAFDSGDARSKDLSQAEKAEKMAQAFKDMFSARTPSEFQESTLAHVRGLDVEYNKAMRASHINFDYEKMDDMLGEVGRLGVPLLSLQATNVDEHNKRIPVKAGEMSRWMRFVQEKVPLAEQFVIEESSHFPQVDQPVEVARRLMEFLRGLGV